jgi:hypothetical protein
MGKVRQRGEVNGVKGIAMTDATPEQMRCTVCVWEVGTDTVWACEAHGGEG